jgi:hypothetical protein
LHEGLNLIFSPRHSKRNLVLSRSHIYHALHIIIYPRFPTTAHTRKHKTGSPYLSIPTSSLLWPSTRTASHIITFEPLPHELGGRPLVASQFPSKQYLQPTYEKTWAAPSTATLHRRFRLPWTQNGKY